MTILEAAIAYAKKGMSVIPVGTDKVPLIKWEPYQKKRASEEEIQAWFKKFPSANIGIVTGEISNLLVVDCDTPASIQQVQEAIPESLTVPCETTPRGGMHFFFSHAPGFSNRARVADGIDIRTEGGYCAVAPSVNGTGNGWVWVLSLLDADPPCILNSITSLFNSLSLSLYARGNQKVTEIVTDSHKYFGEARKDEDLFHTANIMTKGGADPQFMYEVLERLILSWGENPDKKWIETKIKSALDRAEKRERKIADEIREWVLVTSGHFSVTDSHRELNLVTSSHKHAANVAFGRLEKEEKLIEKYGNKRGIYRLIDRTLAIQDWRKAKGKSLDLEFPLGVSRFVKIYPGNIILLEGQKSQGKSAFAIEFCRLNANLFKEKILYQNVEMSDDEFLERFESYGDIRTVEEWDKTMTIIRQTDSWWDKILPDGLNIVDYLVEYKEAFLIAQFIFNIHQKLKNGIALVVVQRDPFKPYPAGGRGVRDIPRLILSLIHHKIKIEDVKSFKKTEFGNPAGLIRRYKQASWWNFVGDGDWEKVEDSKYAAFTPTKNYKDFANG